MRTKPTDSRDERGSALVFSLVAVMVVSILAAGFLQLALAVTRRLSSTSDTLQALNLAEAGLAEAYMGLAVARSGNVGSPEAPAVFGGGLLWVEAEEHANGLVELECTAMYGTGRATLGIVCEPVALGVASLGFFAGEDLKLNPGTRVDSYDSSQGTYAEQVDTPLNNQGLVGSNGDIALASGDLVFGDAVCGPTGTVSLAAGAILTGEASARPALEDFPSVEVPEIALAKGVEHTGGVPLIIPPGEAGFESLVVGQNAQLVLKGPLALVVGSLTLKSDAEMVIDTSDGPVEMFVAESLDLDSGSIVSSTTQVTSDSLIFVTAPAGKTVSFGAKSQFHGFIYAPEADVQVSADYEIFGGLVCRSAQLAAQGKLHCDLALGAALDGRLPLMHSWRVIELPELAASRRIDPFQLMGLDPEALLPPAQAHRDQVLDVRYFEEDGSTHTYLGPESAFDWDLVAKLVYGVRDGVAFLLPDEPAPADASDPLVDLVASSMTSAQLRDALLAANRLSTEALVAACERDPPMSSGDLKAVLIAVGPLDAEVLLSSISSAALGSSALTSVLIDNSPLDPGVLAAALARIPPLGLVDTTNLLSKQ